MQSLRRVYCVQPCYFLASARYAEFTPRPVNQAGAQGEVAGRRVANGGARQRRRRDVHTELLDDYDIMDDEIMSET